MTIIDGTKQCPKCGRYPKFTIMGKGNRNNRRLEYGMLCSNSECSWSYFSIMYESRDKAIAEWNKKVMRHQESKTNTPWHTGTPTEEGWYLCAYGDNFFCANYWYKNGIGWRERWGGILLAWQKITPYEEKQNG